MNEQDVNQQENASTDVDGYVTMPRVDWERAKTAIIERDVMLSFFRYLDGEIPGVLEDLEAIRGEGATGGAYEALAARVLEWARDDEQQELARERDALQGRYDSMVASYAGRITELEAEAAAMRQALERCKAVFQDNEDWSFGPRVELAVDSALSGDVGRALLVELAALRQEMDAIRFAAHMPADYEYGLPSWINQQLYVKLLGMTDKDGRPIRRSEDLRWMFKAARALKECAEWLESRPDYTEGDAATAATARAALANPLPAEADELRIERDQLLVLLAHYDGIGFADLDDWQRAAAICGVQHGVRFADLHADAVKRGRALVEGVKS